MIPYPHRVTIGRRHQGTEDAWGRPGLTDPVPFLVDVPAWVQDLTAEEQALLTQGGVVDAKRLIFLPANLGIREADQITWGTRVIEILSIEDPDGMGEHLEVTGREIVPAPAVPV